VNDFDPFDPYDAASAWCVIFLCDTCNACLEGLHSKVHEMNLGYFHAQGQEAKSTGWYVAGAWTNTEARYIVLCPRCTRASGRTLPSPDWRIVPPDAVLAICESEEV
jgi:hypothetical protein